MDSITQAALGAAVGEAVLGKKIGNKAILIGAIAGTIPDLDVLSRLFVDNQIYGLIYHRGITHSILFTILAAPLFGALTWWYYKKGFNKIRAVQSFIGVFWALFYAAILAGIAALVYYTGNVFSIGMLLLTIGLGVPILKTLYQNIKFLPKKDSTVSMTQWSMLYFFAFLTHWIIDACTAYGTQIFEPFSRYRVAFNNISIVDPLYTGPLLLGLFIAFFAKRAGKRAFWNWFGVSLSTLYMGFTFYAKSMVNDIVARNLEKQGIEAETYITYPSIFNTVLWQTTVVTKDAYYYGMYSFMDEDEEISFTKLPQNHDLIEKYKDDEFVGILLWFAQGYYNVIEKEDGTLLFNNLRFGLMGTTNENTPVEDRYIFRFILKPNEKGIDVKQDEDVERIKMEEMAPALWQRINGHK
jgi:inner membrane protein